MSFSFGEEFNRKYKSVESFRRALRRQMREGHGFSPEGKAAVELLEIIGMGVILTGSCAATGAKIGMFVGPQGAAAGALIGAAIGLTATFYVAEWYVSVKRHRDGTITATFSPA